MPSDDKLEKDGKLTPAEQGAAGFGRQFAVAFELPFVMVAAIIVGGLLGFFLDEWLHSKPYLMLAFGFLGFFAGLRDVLRRLSKS
jgi:ATP synthase protein I